MPPISVPNTLLLTPVNPILPPNLMPLADFIRLHLQVPQLFLGLQRDLALLKIYKMQKNQTVLLATVSAPGKIILCGEHAVVYGEDALAFAINLRCSAKIFQIKNDWDYRPLILTEAPNKLYEIRKNSLQNLCQFTEYLEMRRKQGQTDKEKIKFEYKYQVFKNHTNLQIPPQKRFKIEMQSDVPIGKCLGSSAAFNTVLAATFFYLSQVQHQIDYEQVNEMSKLFQKVEHGTPSGIDNFVATYGGLVLFNNKKNPQFQSITSPQILLNLNETMHFFLVDSGLKKNTKKAVQNVRTHYNSGQQYKNMIEEIGQYAGKLLDLLNQSEKEGEKWKDEILEILEKNHVYLRELGVSTPEIEEIVKQWTIGGEQCVKITGAGMGGYVLVINTKNRVEHKQNVGKIKKIDFDPIGLKIDKCILE